MEHHPLIIRRYESGEEPAVWNVYFRATRESNSRDYHPDLIERWAPVGQDMGEWRVRLEEKSPFVAILDGQIVGMAELEEDGFVDYFYVLPDFERRGIGSALLGKIREQAALKGLADLRAEVSVTAKPFFEKHGFSVIKAKHHVIIGHPAPNFLMAIIL